MTNAEDPPAVKPGQRHVSLDERAYDNSPDITAVKTKTMESRISRVKLDFDSDTE